MDDRRFDQIAKALGATGSRRTGLRAALAGLLGAAGLAVMTEPAAEAARRRRGGGPGEARKTRRKKRCDPECGPGYACVKDGRKRICRCPSGIACAGTCCASGKECRDGACADPEPEPSCVAFGEACKDVGRRCCEGLECGSGSDGGTAVACHRALDAACAATAECAYGLECRGGRCQSPPPVEGLAVPCNAAAQQQCTSPGATCTTYTTPGAPDGAFCTLPVGAVCEGDPECSCFRCWYPNGQRSGRNGRAAEKTCCQPAGEPCGSAADCCLGLPCSGGVCGGSGGEVCPENRVCAGNTACCPAGQVCDVDDACCLETRAVGATCTVDGDCCSGVCASGKCADTCPAERVCGAGAACCDAGAVCSGGQCVGGTCSGNGAGQCPSTVCACSATPNSWSSGTTNWDRCWPASWEENHSSPTVYPNGWYLESPGSETRSPMPTYPSDNVLQVPGGGRYGVVAVTSANTNATLGPVAATDATYRTQLGGASSALPAGANGYGVEMDVYLDPASTGEGEVFHATVGASSPNCAYRAEYMIYGGKRNGVFCLNHRRPYTTAPDAATVYAAPDCGATGSANAYPYAPFTITQAGWYTLRWEILLNPTLPTGLENRIQPVLSVLRGGKSLVTWTRTGENVYSVGGPPTGTPNPANAVSGNGTARFYQNSITNIRGGLAVGSTRRFVISGYCAAEGRMCRAGDCCAGLTCCGSGSKANTCQATC